ncbi:unnamed protein product, partial [Amoebophrya sp. A120]
EHHSTTLRSIKRHQFDAWYNEKVLPAVYNRFNFPDFFGKNPAGLVRFKLSPLLVHSAVTCDRVVCPYTDNEHAGNR